MRVAIDRDGFLGAHNLSGRWFESSPAHREPPAISRSGGGLLDFGGFPFLGVVPLAGLLAALRRGTNDRTRFDGPRDARVVACAFGCPR